ncbi:AarF/ABC1/UbiB kinase family protein [Campylobacter blaseri]|uniref:ABC transporter n=1 Tax=Campylobacter blaseri TaxID=2042961 RepID=A0A2P8R2L7_9BACT|nr:AarF/UbiB family protein [Campylobacter blaseri]PSM52754.1 ABC transporter [Campylobacter blaseri]PSM54402.1 ABC transporter [Campylobacter blaseri]QKF86063.1 AarF/ABC1/UbiB kinase family protein [Campylobacter blaseri]
MRRNSYNPIRIWNIFHLLLTFFLLIRKKDSIFFIKPIKAEKISLYINSLGASFIKLAQVLATRSDFFSSKYLNELKKIHDELPPMSKVELSKFDISKFKTFNTTPIAAASIGQVHEAYLKDGTKVAVKLRRVGIEKQVKTDITIINTLNSLFKPLFSHYTKNSLEAVISEFSDTIIKEVNMRIELLNLEKFKKIYKNLDIKTPNIYKEYCNESMLVMSFEEGFRFDDRKNIKKYNIDIKKAINILVLSYVEQMLINGYFHADPHPGNVLVNKNSEVILLDFGMVKTVPNETRLAIISLLQAANNQDYIKYIAASKKLGISAYETPNVLLAEFVERVFEIFSNDALSSSNMQKLMEELMQNTRKFPFKLPAEAIYILRVSAIIEGLGTTYIENFNGIKDILPILTKNIPRAFGAKDTLVETLIDELTQIPDNIENFKNTFYKIGQGELEVELSKLQLSYFKKAIDEQINSIIFSLVLIFISFFMLIYDKDLILFSSFIFIIGVLKLLYRK